jgi:hypothetical protein
LPKCVHVVVTHMHGNRDIIRHRVGYCSIRCDNEADSVLVTPQRCFMNSGLMIMIACDPNML